MSINTVYQHLQAAEEELKKMLDDAPDPRLRNIHMGVREVENAVFAYGNSLEPTG